jgi:hypothetical protein
MPGQFPVHKTGRPECLQHTRTVDQHMGGQAERLPSQGNGGRQPRTRFSLFGRNVTNFLRGVQQALASAGALTAQGAVAQASCAARTGAPSDLEAPSLSAMVNDGTSTPPQIYPGPARNPKHTLNSRLGERLNQMGMPQLGQARRLDGSMLHYDRLSIASDQNLR